MADLPGYADCAGHFDPNAAEESILPIPVFRNVAQDNTVRTRTEITTDFLPVLYSIASILVQRSGHTQWPRLERGSHHFAWCLACANHLSEDTSALSSKGETNSN